MIGERQLLDALELGDAQKAERILYDIFKQFDKKELFSSTGGKLRNKLIELIVIAHRIAMDLNVEEDVYLNYNGYLGEVLQIDDPGAFEAWYKNRITYLAIKIKKTREMTTSKIISDAKHYIGNNYSQDISLDALSWELGISPQYFSKLFKKEMGVNFIEYLTQLRLKKAKGNHERRRKIDQGNLLYGGIHRPELLQPDLQKAYRPVAHGIYQRSVKYGTKVRIRDHTDIVPRTVRWRMCQG